jgi:hypothetical protein
MAINTLDQLKTLFRKFNVQVIYLKELSEKQDNTKNQIYLGTSLDRVSNLVPMKIGESGGNIVGVARTQLNKLKVAEVIGSIPENVNFGIKASTVRQFLISSGLSPKKIEQKEEKSTEQLAEIAKNQALMVMCLQ